MNINQNHKKILLFTIEPQKIFDLIKNHVEKKFEYLGYKFSVRRTRIYAQLGCRCVKCGIEGNEFRLEQWKDGNLHLDLYHVPEKGEKIMMTIDHVHPRSKGGEDSIENYKPMCEPCNWEKGNKVEED